jgi:hypothetical protein
MLHIILKAYSTRVLSGRICCAYPLFLSGQRFIENIYNMLLSVVYCRIFGIQAQKKGCSWRGFFYFLQELQK